MRTLNLGILAHVDAGKTSLTERLLFDNGSIGQLGSVDSGSTQTDTDELERQRGITIRSAVASFAVGDLQVNLVDTPGHPDFIAEVERVLVVLDAAILVLSAVEGVQAQSRVLMKSLTRLGLPTLLFVNKIDRRGARQDDLVADIRRRLAPGAIAVQRVDGLGTRAARTVAALDARAGRRGVAEGLAEHDDALLARLLEDEVPSRSELEERLAGQTAAGLVCPVFFGSALTGQGTAELTAGIGTLLGGCRGERSRSAAGGGPRGTVFAIERGSGGEKVAYLRLFSGQVRERQRLRLVRREPGGGVSRITGSVTGLEVIAPADGGVGGVLTAGNIGRIRGLSRVRVGDRLGEPGGEPGEASDAQQFPPPSLETIVTPAEPGQAARLHAGLVSLADEDPLIRARPAGGGATSVLLYGAVQQEVIAARLERDFGVTARFEPVRPVYFERPAGTGEACEQIQRHGPNEFMATVGLRVERAERGAGLSFTRQVENGALPRAFHRAIEDTVLVTLERGLHGWEVTDCAVTLIQAGYSSPSSVAADFRGRTPLVLMQALRAAGTRVYEPCHHFEAEIPGDVLSLVLNHLAGLGAEVAESADTGSSWLVTGEIPARLVQEFTRALPGLTRGEGSWWSQPAGDRPVRGRPPERAAGW
jgi:ribosomal protection tetracycline resistance protein